MSSAIGAGKPGTDRAFRTCSMMNNRRLKNIRENRSRRTTSGSIFAAAICISDSECG